MKRFIGVLTFFLLFLAVKADTVSRNHVYIGDSLVADTYWGEIIYLKLKPSSFSPTDSLKVERYFGCGGTLAAKGYTLSLTDPRNGNILYVDSSMIKHDFSISMQVIYDLLKNDPGLSDISLFYIPNDGWKSSSVRFLITME